VDAYLLQPENDSDENDSLSLSSLQAQKIKITIAFFSLSGDSFLVSKWKEANANIL
jgi:hypothetical protein